MKYKNLLLFLGLSILGLSGVQAQKGITRLDLGYQVALPVGFNEQINKTSFRGFNAAILHGLSSKVSVGLGTGFQDFYQKEPRQLYKLSDGSDVSAVLTNSIQTTPILVQGKYAFAPEAAVQPYAALGVGGNLIRYSQLLGEFGDRQAKIGFAARPEAGLYIPFKKGGEKGLRIGASYNIMPFEELGFKNLNHVGFNAGISIPLRK
jgi:opacity protein-like surface antigen